MWFLPSRRPHLIERVFSVVPPTVPGVIIVDPDLSGQYDNKKLPWPVVVVDGCTCLRDKINWAYNTYPNEDYYAGLNDDMIPETPHWDKILADRAGTNKIAGADQVHIPLRAGATATGGDIVRACGWWFCPKLEHFYGDDVTELIGSTFNCMTVYTDVRIAHLHFTTNLGSYDDVYAKRSGSDDHKAFDEWKRVEWPAVRERLAKLY